MLKSGLIIGLIMLIFGGGASLITPLCVPCLAVLGGLGAGYLAGMFDRPPDSIVGQLGAGAGAIAGIGALLGHIVGGLINAALVGPDAAADMLSALGFSGPIDPTTYYAGVIGGSFCFGLLEIGLMAGLGALGGLLWRRVSSQNKTTTPEI